MSNISSPWLSFQLRRLSTWLQWGDGRGRGVGRWGGEGAAATEGCQALVCGTVIGSSWENGHTALESLLTQARATERLSWPWESEALRCR